jgi:dihydropteroate synthase
VNLREFLANRPRPAVMGILNVTPDSFSDGGLYFRAEDAISRGLLLAARGADILDVGGESTRPSGYGHASEVGPDEEVRRTAPVIAALASRLAIPLSIDTRKAPVARAALEAGATIVNDVTAFRFDPEMAPAVAASDAAAILMHMRGLDPRSMQEDLEEGDPWPVVETELADAIASARLAGIPDSRLAVDPGLGFGKTMAQNIRLIEDLDRLAALGLPVVVGASRKAFVRHYSGDGANPMSGSLAAAAAAAERGAAVVRVHDVGETVRLLRAHEGGASWIEAAEAQGADAGTFSRMFGTFFRSGRADRGRED